MSTRDIAIEFLEKELEAHKQQQSKQRREFDTRLKPLREEKNEVVNEIESAKSLIEGLQAKLKDFEVLDKCLDEHIKKEEKAFETEMASLDSKIIGLDTAVMELKKGAGVVEVKREHGAIESKNCGDSDMDDVVAGDSDGVTDTSMVDAAAADVHDDTRVDDHNAVATPSSDPLNEHDDAPSENTESSMTPVSNTRLSSSDHAAEILSRILPAKLPSFEKRKIMDGPTQPPVERLKRRKRSFVEEINIFITPRKKPGPKPKPKKTDLKAEKQTREPLAQLSINDPNSYSKQFGRRRKVIEEDSDGSWQGSDEEEMKAASDAADDSSDDDIDAQKRGRRSREPEDEDGDVTGELFGELTELVKECDGVSGTRRRGVKSMAVVKKDKSLMADCEDSDGGREASMDSLFFEEPAFDEVAGGEVIPADRCASSESADEAPSGSEVKLVACSVSEEEPRPTPETTTKQKAKGLARESHSPVQVKTEVVDASFSPPPLPTPSLSTSQPKLPGLQELGLIDRENTTECHTGAASLKCDPPTEAVRIPTGPRGFESASEIDNAGPSREPPGNQQDPASHKLVCGNDDKVDGWLVARLDSYGRHDFRKKELTWDQISHNADLWAHLHHTDQLKGLCTVRGRYVSIKCVHAYPGIPCQHTFGTLRDLRIHMYKEHSIKTYVCLLCKAAYARKSGLWAHCKQDHDGQMGKYWRGHSDHV